MVKQKPSANLDRNLNNYRTRTSHGGTINSSRPNPANHNHVPIARSTGCCSTKKVAHVPSHPVVVRQSPPTRHSPPPQQQTAHERSHHRLDPPDPFFHRHGRIRKNPNRARRPYQPQHGRNQIHSVNTAADPRQKNRNQIQSVNTAADPWQKNRNTNYQAPPPRPPAPVATKKNCCCTIL